MHRGQKDRLICASYKTKQELLFMMKLTNIQLSRCHIINHCTLKILCFWADRYIQTDRVRTDLEKSLKMTLVLENSWNCKKVQFVLELSMNFEKISLIIAKSP